MSREVMATSPNGRLSLAVIPALLAIAAILVAAPAEPAPAPTPEQIIAARQASFDLSVMAMAEMKLAVKDGLGVKKQFYAASTIARWAKVLPTMFPAGTGQGSTSVESSALSDVWTDRAG